MNKNHHWLAKQLPLWVDDELISGQQADALQLRHPTGDSAGLGRMLLTGIGAIMIGLGIILLFAYNWADMSKFAKLGVIFAALIGTHALAMTQIGRNTILAEGLFAVGTMMMGAAIFLIGQVYHMDSHYPDAFLLWSLGALALAWARPSLTQALMAIVMVLSWHMMEVFDFHFANNAAFLVVTIGVMPLVWRVGSPVLGRFASASLFFTLGLSIAAVNTGLVTITLLMISLAMLSAEQIAKKYGSQSQITMANEIAKPAGLVLIIILVLMTFGGLLDSLARFSLNDTLTNIVFWLALFLSQLGFVLLAYKRQLNGIMVLAEIALALAFMPTLVSFFPHEMAVRGLYHFVSTGFNLLLLSTSIWLMVDGAKNANRRHMVRGCILFAILAMARYTDLFDSLVARAVVFLVVGAALFWVGSIYQRNKAKSAS